MLTLGILHAQIVATQMSHRQKRHNSERQPWVCPTAEPLTFAFCLRCWTPLTPIWKTSCHVHICSSKQRSRKKKAQFKYQAGKNSANGSNGWSHEPTLQSYCGLRRRRGKCEYRQQPCNSLSGEKRQHFDQEQAGSEEEVTNDCSEEKGSHCMKRRNKSLDPVANRVQTSQRESRKAVATGFGSSDGCLSYISADGEETMANSQERVEDLGQTFQSSGELLFPDETTSTFHLMPSLLLPSNGDDHHLHSTVPLSSKDQCVPCQSSGPGANDVDKSEGVHLSNDVSESYPPHQLETPELRPWTVGVSNKQSSETDDLKLLKATGESADTASSHAGSRPRSALESCRPNVSRSHKEGTNVEMIVRPETLNVAFRTDTTSNGGTSCESEGEMTPSTLPSTLKVIFNEISIKVLIILGCVFQLVRVFL